MNPNIALSFQRPKFDPAEGQRNALAMRQAQMQEAAGMMQLQSAQVAAERETARRNALAGVDWNSPGSLQQAAGAAGSVGDIDAVLAINQHMSALNKEQRAAKEAELKAVPRLAGFFQAPETWGHGLTLARQYAPELAATLPEQYDPKAAESINMMALGADGWLKKNQGEEKNRLYSERTTMLANRPASGVTVVNAQQGQEDKEYGKDLVKQFSGVREAADMAQGELASLQQLKAIDVNTGKLEELKTGIAAYAQALGLDPAALNLRDPTNAQSFVGTAQQLVLRVMQAQKGPQTENDAKRIERTVASLGNTPEAKDFLIDSAMAVRQRDIDRADFYDNWRESKGTFDGARKAWRMHIEKTPLLGNNPKTGRPVFYNQFKDAVIQANPGITEDAVLAEWRKKYGR